MRLIIAGSRNFLDYSILNTEINDIIEIHNITEIVSGTANDADKLGETYAMANNIPIKRFPAKWDLYGKSAGYRRNSEMAQYADILACFIVANSRGSTHMVSIMRNLNKPVFEFHYDQ